MFISSSQALDLLQEHAPRAWCKRLLQWQILDRALNLYFTSGQVTQKRQAGYYLLDMFQDPESAKPTLALVGEHFGKEIEDKLRTAGCPEEPEVKDCFGLNVWVELETERWTNEPRGFPVGVLIFAEEIDWESGSVSNSEFSLDDTPDFLFEGAEEYLGTMERYAEVAYKLDGMCFDFSLIEMMAPGSSEVKNARTLDRVRAPRPEVGRPRKWDWEGALRSVIKIANTPDGLPEGYGAQASIERAMADWFIATAGSTPPESEIRKRAAEIVRATSRK